MYDVFFCICSIRAFCWLFVLTVGVGVVVCGYMILLVVCMCAIVQCMRIIEYVQIHSMPSNTTYAHKLESPPHTQPDLVLSHTAPPPELTPLLQGAWLNRPGNVITKRKYFFQLSADKTVWLDVCV